MSDKHDTPIAESLESVLCDPEGRCCIYGSDEDRRIVDNAITDVAIMERELAASRAEAEHLARDYNAVAQQSRDYQAEVGKLLVHRDRLTAELSANRESTLAAEVERWKAQCKWEREEVDRVTGIRIMLGAEIDRLAAELSSAKASLVQYIGSMGK